MNDSRQARAAVRAEISKMLANTAGILLAGAMTFLIFAMEKRAPAAGFWIVFLLGVLAVVVSIALSGAAMDKNAPRLYRGQTWTLLLGLLLMFGSLPLSGGQERGMPEEEIRMKEMGELQNRLEELERENDELRQGAASLYADIEQLRKTRQAGTVADAAERVKCVSESKLKPDRPRQC